MLLSCSKIRLSWVLIPPQTDGISCTHTHKPRVRIIWKLNQRCFQILTSDWRWSETEGSIRSTHRALYSRLTWTLSIKTAAAGFIDVQFILYLTTGPRVHTVMHRYIHPREKLRHHSCIQRFGETSSLSFITAVMLTHWERHRFRNIRKAWSLSQASHRTQDLHHQLPGNSSKLHCRPAPEDE